MTDREYEPMEQVPTTSVEKPRPSWMVPLIVGAAALLLGIGIGYGVGSSNDSGAPSGAASTNEDSPAEETPAEETEEPAYVPTAADFSIKLSVKDRECFGSAGCNVTYRVEPNYEGAQTPTGTWEITYEVRGIEDGPQIQTFTLEDDSFSFEPEILAQTKNANSKAKAVITGVVEGY